MMAALATVFSKAAARFCVLLCTVILCCQKTVEATVIVNEVLANEPKSYVTLEWIELMNDAPTPVSLGGYGLKIGTRSIELPGGVRLDSGEFYVVCRQLLAEGSSPGFESVWGDSSGVWGDTPEEGGMQVPFEATYSLTNSGGSVELYDSLSVLVSEFFWSDVGQDGFSWERRLAGSDEIVQSIDASGSTPGRINSQTPVNYDLALEEVSVDPQNGACGISLLIVNRGLVAVSESYLLLLAGGDSGGVVDSMAFGPLGPAAGHRVTRDYLFEGVYANLTALLPDDDRVRNNRRDLVATGRHFPPLILSEILVNPQAPLQTEWVELVSRHSEPVDLAGWRLGDALTSYPIVGDALSVRPGEYLVLTEDSLAFLEFYKAFAGRLIQPSRWAVLNNHQDVVRLVDHLGFTADRFEYLSAFADNRSWGRGSATSLDAAWGSSERAGGSPAAPNSVVYEPYGSSLVVNIAPKVFSPNGDGFEDEAVIVIEAPSDAPLNMRVYDRHGRVVRTLLDRATLLRRSYTWNGRSDSGRRLPIGIYILFVEAEGMESVKKPVVIAR